MDENTKEATPIVEDFLDVGIPIPGKAIEPWMLRLCLLLDGFLVTWNI